MSAIIQGLRTVYKLHGHTTAWSISRDGVAQGNPLIENRDISLLRRAHRVHLAKVGALTLKARPITAAIVCDLAAKFWEDGDALYSLLHAILLTGLNLGLRYDEISKL